jgi:hypothetical protein
MFVVVWIETLKKILVRSEMVVSGGADVCLYEKAKVDIKSPDSDYGVY